MTPEEEREIDDLLISIANRRMRSVIDAHLPARMELQPDVQCGADPQSAPLGPEVDALAEWCEMWGYDVEQDACERYGSRSDVDCYRYEIVEAVAGRFQSWCDHHGIKRTWADRLVTCESLTSIGLWGGVHSWQQDHE